MSSRFSKLPSIVGVHIITGKVDCLLTYRTKDFETIRSEIVVRLRKEIGIGNIQTVFSTKIRRAII